MQLGFYMGFDLNSADDNLTFTLLFKRPKWFIRKSPQKEAEIFEGLSIFEKAMTARFTPSISESRYIIRSATEIAVNGHDKSHSGRGMWAIKRALNILKFKHIDISRYIGWGWKEPNTHLFIDYLAKYFHDVRYIHVIRNGLDMAYSTNQAQLYNWGTLFGVMPNPSESLPKLSLQYWIRANNRAINKGRKLLGERFLLINFDRLCLFPEEETSLLINFLGLSESNIDINTLKSLPKVPSSMGRYMKHDMSVFDKSDIQAVLDLGFEVFQDKGNESYITK